ncbi:hypothetical protein Atai01_38410 [Amycolatopsis taiwanensis]|uniref:Putative restriction endonuclease domain-containing protein n=2 Tax=Amycolatopsis taiwanensis TaxID=342230 RepID=A0A9W6VH87_9PSEU|nr:hypothetical protein Atai01_38410 [Amycolatopsis taiwanensis]
MTLMTATAGSARSGSFTVRDLEGMPDDGRRYELIDGELFVSPASGTRHQSVAYLLFGVLHAACPAHLKVLGAPFAVKPHGRTELQPDLLVGRRADFTDKLLPVAPLLAVEVLSRSTAKVDLEVKKRAYERLGTECYWVIDPAHPSMLVYELDGEGRYAEVARVAEEKPFYAERPFDVRIVLTDLVDEFGPGW